MESFFLLEVCYGYFSPMHGLVRDQCESSKERTWLQKNDVCSAGIGSVH